MIALLLGLAVIGQAHSDLDLLTPDFQINVYVGWLASWPWAGWCSVDMLDMPKGEINGSPASPKMTFVCVPTVSVPLPESASEPIDIPAERSCQTMLLSYCEFEWTCSNWPDRIQIGPDGHGKYFCHLPQTGGK